MNDKTTINYSIALILNDAINKILYEVKDGNLIERPLAFGLKYKLGKNIAYIEKDLQNLNEAKLKLIATLGEPSEDGKNVIIKDDNKKAIFVEAMNELLLKEVSHSISKLDPKDLEAITENIDIDYNTLKIFEAYMCNEPELYKELNTDIQFTFNIPTEEPKVKKIRKSRKKKEENTNE